MSTDQEIIEARLAAYVEGDLTPGERGKIEKYLAANPQHAQLIQDLQAQKGRLEVLPRERAPAEVLDHLQAHLERSALLENVEAAAEAMRIRRWPQWTAAAAMLLLAVGLGALVYQVLPSGNPTQVTMAPSSIQQLPSAPTLKSDELEDKKDLSFAGGARVAEPRGRDFVEQLADKMAAESEKNRQRREGEQPLKTTPKDQPVPMEGAPMPATPLAPPVRATMVSLNNSSAILVETDDTLITQNLVAGFLAQNKIEFQTVPQADLREAAAGAGPTTEPTELALAGTDSLAAQQPQIQSHQRLDGVVSKLRSKQEMVAKKSQQSDEAYLLARNVSADQAEEITKAFAAQRGGKQQARYYTNAQLYPELQQQQQQSPQGQAAQYNGQAQAGAANMTPAPTSTQPVDAAFSRAAAEALASPLPGGTTQPTTVPTAEHIVANAFNAASMQTTDVLIVVRSDADIAPTTQPTPATQPTTAPTTLPVAP